MSNENESQMGVKGQESDQRYPIKRHAEMSHVVSIIGESFFECMFFKIIFSSNVIHAIRI